MSQVAEKRLIFNADDFGWSRGISDGILKAHWEGVVKSTTLMVNQPASEYALEQAKRAPDLGVGIHLQLCDGSPVLPAGTVRSLVDADGKFHSIAELKRRLWRGRIMQGEIEAEFRAQIRWLKDRGTSPTHADSHHHVHVHPLVAGPFRRALRTEGIFRARPARQEYLPRNGTVAGAHSGPVYRRVLLRTYLSLLERTVFRSLESPGFRLAIHPRYQQKLELLGEAWRAAIESLPPGACELECHPGLSEPGFSEADKWRHRREVELGLLTDPDLRLWIEKDGIQLISYRELERPTE